MSSPSRLFVFVIATAALVNVAESNCETVPFYKMGYGTGKQQEHHVEVPPLFQAVGPGYYSDGTQLTFNMTDPLLADCAGFWFLTSSDPSGLIQPGTTLYEMGLSGATGYWCSGGQNIRQHFDGTMITDHASGWQSTIRLTCEMQGGSPLPVWIAEGMLHGNGTHHAAVHQIECNTMAQQYGPCTTA